MGINACFSLFYNQCSSSRIDADKLYIVWEEIAVISPPDSSLLTNW